MKPQPLADLPLFADMSRAERDELLNLARPVEVGAGERLITQGQLKQNLWFILEGRCVVTRRTESGCQLKLAELEPPTHFGEMSFFDAAPHSADVIAETPMKLLRLSREDYDKLHTNGSCVAYKLALNCARELADRLRKTDQWITELVCQDNHKPSPSEWTTFRELIFKGE